MSFSDAIERGLRRRKEYELMTTVSPTDSGFEAAIVRGLQRREEDIAPTVSTIVEEPEEEKKDEDDKLDFFQKGVFDDGYQVGDISKSILGTVGDVGLGIAKGAGGMVEGVADLINYGIAGVADATGNDSFAERVRKRTQESAIDAWTKDLDTYLNKYSILGRTSDSIAQGIGQVGTILLTGGIAGAAGLGAAGATAATTGVMGLSGMGSGMSEAYQGGAADGEAAAYGLIAGAADALSELIFGGLGKAVKATGLSTGLSSADDMLAKKVSGLFKNQIAKNFAEFGVKASAEGVEEVVAGIAQAIGKKATYMSDEDWGKILKDENLLEQFIVGAVTSGIVQAPGLHISNKAGSDFVTGMTKNEQAVVQKEVETRIAEQEADGRKLTAKEKHAIEAQVEKDLEKGYISTDTIEEVLGGENYRAYKDTIDKENALAEQQKALQEEFDQLNDLKQGEMTGKQIDRRAELKTELAEIKEMIAATENHSPKNMLKQRLSDSVSEMVKGERLAESYNERTRRSQAYEADLTKYDAKQQAVVQKAVESGILNNTNRTHEFVDMVAKISADKGILFDFTNNEKLKNSGFAVDGKTVNGYVTKDGITVNIQSSKALNSIVGHEITHVLEGTDLYAELQTAVVEYAKTKGDYQGRFDSLSKLYEAVEGADINAELTADLVGDYLFTDADFVNNLSTQHRNVFQKIYDEVKYLLKVAAAGSKEARELEKVKKAFEDAYRTETKNPTKDGGAKYSIGEITDSNGKQYGIGVHLDSTLLDNLTPDERIVMVKEYVKELGGESFTAYDPDGNAVNITIAKPGAKFKNKSGRKVNATSDLTAYLKNEVKQEAIVHVDELVQTSFYHGREPATHPHDWLDDNGSNDWDLWKTYIQDKQNTVWEASLRIANSTNGEKVLYDIYPIKKVEGAGTSATTTTNSNLTHGGENVNPEVELTDDGHPLTKNVTEEVQFSLSNDTVYMDKAIAMNDSSLRVDSNIMTDAKAIRERIAVRMNDIKDRGLVGLPEDIEGNTYIANSSYDGTEENTTICPRSLASEAFVDAVSEYLGRPLTVEEQIYISQDLQGRSLTPECTYCYVATDRKAYRAFLGEYVAQRDAVLQQVKDNPNADVSRNGEMYKSFLNGRKDTNPMYSRFKMWVNAYKNGKPMIDASHLANINRLMGDINSEFGAELKPQIVDAMKYAQSASWAKKRVNYVAYNGHILNWKQDRINKLNSHYGLRMYSFSDFHPAFVLENMQMITDASVRGLKMLGYTKDTDFVEIFAPSEMNINVSTFGFESGGNVYENNIIGAEWEKAKALRDQYPNVGVTFVASNDTLVNWALEQDWIDVVIPYHLVRTGAEVAKAFGYTNYTSESGDTKTREWAKGDKKSISPTEHNNDKVTYFDALEKNHLNPRFARFQDNPNYMKLVNECRQSASESKPVQPVFNEDAAMKALAKLEANGYYQPIGGSVDRMYEIAAEVAEDMQSQLAPVMSLSEIGEQPRRYGDRATLGKDVELAPVQDDIGPVAENATVSEMESVAPVAISETETATEDSSVTSAADDAHPFKTTKEKLNEKLTNRQTELENIKKLRAEANKSYSEKIAQAQAQLDAKKNKDTKVANNLKMRIERLQRLKVDIDAKYAKRITDINKSIGKTSVELEKDHTEKDRYAKAKARIERNLEMEKAALSEEYARRKAELESKVSDKSAYFSNKARELYEELRNLRKGVRASTDLGSLLDFGYDWGNLRSALSNVRYNPAKTVNVNSAEESAVRQLINEAYENDVYSIDDLDLELSEKINELETKADEDKKAARTATQRRAKQEEYTALWENLIGDTSNWKDFALGITYKTKTLRRILRNVVRNGSGDPDFNLADDIYDELETKYDHNEAQLKMESKRLKEVFTKLNLNKYEDTYAHMVGELRHNPETGLSRDMVDEYYQKHRNRINSQKVETAITEARKTFDDLIVRVNEVLREQGIKEIPYRKGYFPHFTNPKQNWFQKLINWKPINTEIPTSIAGLTQDFKPVKSWQSFAQQRRGDTTDYSLYQGLDTYIHGALDWIYHIEDIQKRRSLENWLRYTHSSEGIQQRIDKIKADDTLDANEAQDAIDAVLAESNNPLSGLVRELMNRTNTLANKKSSMDREMEDMFNRKVYSTMTNLNNRINANMVVGSLSSALTNFIPMVQSWHQVSPAYTVKGLRDMIRSTIKDDGMIARSDFLTNRLIEEEKLYKTGWDKASDKAAILMNVIDNITSQTVWRSKYLQNLGEGMSETQAIKDADQFAKNLIAGRSRGNMPSIFDAKNPVTKLFTAFQLEVANQYGYMFEDVPQESTSKARLVKGYATAFLGAYVYNALYSAMVGRDAAFDPIAIIQDLIGDLMDDDEEPEEALAGFASNVIEEIPFVGSLIGGGRVPMSSAFPYSNDSAPFQSLLSDVESAWNDGNWTEGNWKPLVTEMLKPLYYLALPFGGGQIKKTNEGLGMFSDDHPVAGSYTDSGRLRFPVEDTVGNRVQAALFGQYSSDNARDYFDNGRSALTEKQIAEYMELDAPIQDYWEYRDGLSGLSKLEEKIDYINGLNLTTAQKNVLVNNLTDRKEAIDMTDYDQYGSLEEFDYANKNPEKYAYFEEIGITYEAYKNADDDTKDAYDWAFENPEKYTVSKAVSDDYLTYYQHKKHLDGLDAKDESGKTVSGLKKERVLDYINGLDMDYGQKIILYRSMYNSKADREAYNQDIVDYLNSRDDISYEEMVTILKELDFTIGSDGVTIYWD